jgi:hypothetical protein
MTRPASVFLVLLLLLCTSGASQRKPIYRNREFGIVLSIPSGTLPCIPPFYRGNGIDHGPEIVLDANDASLCSKPSGKRYMDVFASYTTTEEEKSLDSYLHSICDDLSPIESDPGAVCSRAPADLSVNGLTCRAAMINHSNGWTEIIVVTQAGKPAPDFDPSVPSISYELSLYSDSNHFDQDLAVFRAMLKTIRLAPHNR